MRVQHSLVLPQLDKADLVGLLGVLIEVVRQAAVFLTGFGNQLIAMLQELIQLGRFDFELGNYGNHHDSLVLVDRRLAAFD